MRLVNLVRSLTFSVDGARVVSGGNDKVVRVWDVSTGLQVGATVEGHSDWVRAVAHSPNNKQVASGSRDGTVRVWDAETGILCFRPLEHNSFEWVYSLAYSPDGRRLASGGDKGNIHIWDSNTGENLNHLEMGQGWVRGIAFSLDDTRIACRLESEIRIWELDGNGYDLKDPTGLLGGDNSKQSSTCKEKNLGKV